MALIAKFRVDAVTQRQMSDGEGGSLIAEEVELMAVYSDDPEHPNHSWSKWTPSGNLTMQITNPEGTGYLVPGEEYFVEIRKARAGKG